VWDLTVPGVECFSLANGAVVHNSADAFRYLACTVRQSDLLTQPPVPEEEKPAVRDLRTISIRAYLGDKWDPTRPTATRQD
jgi:hypothetical protein